MTFLSKANNATSRVADVGGIDGATDPVTFNVTTGEGSKFPASNFLISIDNEILLCTSRTGDALTCDRAEEGTIIATHSQNSTVELRITKGTLEQYDSVFQASATDTEAEVLHTKEQSSTPTTPSSGNAKIYVSSDGQPKLLLDTGEIHNFELGSPSLSRQALINGNFDVWQRGTSTTGLAAYDLADRWRMSVNVDGGTLPTITRSRQALTPGDIANAFYYYRIAPNGAGSGLGNSSLYSLEQRIEHGTRFLCGASKKVTLSFWARSSISGKKIGSRLSQNYGTGGSPSAQEIISGNNFTLTSTWQKFTQTFDTNTLVGKTFGTANDDYLDLFLAVQWGSAIGSNFGLTSTAESLASGTIDIAQVQLCAGDVALPFMPKSFEDELRACQRYYEKSFNYATAPAQNVATDNYQFYFDNCANGVACGDVRFKVTKRSDAPTITTYNPYAANSSVRQAATSTDFAVGVLSGDNGFTLSNASGGTGPDAYCHIHWTADAEL